MPETASRPKAGSYFMKINRKMMAVAGTAMVVIVAVAIVSLHYLAAVFSASANAVAEATAESRRIWIIEKKIDQMHNAVRNFARTGEQADALQYRNALTEIHNVLQAASQNEPAGRRDLFKALLADLELMESKAERIFSQTSLVGGQEAITGGLLGELSSLHAWFERDIMRYQEWNEAWAAALRTGLEKNTGRMKLIFVLVVLISLGTLFTLVLYLNRKVSVPLNELWEGTEEISRGNLDFQMKVHGEDDIALLGRRFNEMASRLKSSYAELEQKLLERTHELASLDAVALTLSHAGSLRDLLDKSLARILDSLGNIEPRGGVFLYQPGGETLLLAADQGLSPEFVEQETVIRAGECLCGLAASSGELLVAHNSCEDQRVTRKSCHDCRARIAVPIKSRGIVLGVIFLHPEEGFTLKTSDIQMLETIGAQLGMAVENFRFYVEVKESSEKYWDLFENASEILFTINASGKLTAANKAAEDFSGYTKMELFGKTVFDFLTPEGTETARKLLVGRESGQWTEFEIVKRDGSRAFVEVSARRLFANRKPSGFQVSARDVTGQKHLREMLLQAERLGAIGQVVITVRHEINNPLTTVIGNIELLLERYEGKDRELTNRLETVLNNAIRIAEIVKQLQSIRKDRVVEYRNGMKMTDLAQG